MTISFQERGEHLVVRHGRERARERERRGRRPAGVARKGVTNKEPGTTLGKTTDTRRRRPPFLHKVAEHEGGRKGGREGACVDLRPDRNMCPASLSPAAAAIKHAVQSLASPEISLSLLLAQCSDAFILQGSAKRRGLGCVNSLP